MKKNTDLIAYCEKALKEKWVYLWGTYGQKATQALLESNIRQYPSNENWRSYASKAIPNNRFCDCYGLLKGFMWSDSNGVIKYGSNGCQDTNTGGAYSKAKEKGTLATLPEIPGIVLYMTGHVGYYVGNGRFIECAGGVGVVEGKIQGGKVVKGSKFTHWFKDVNIDYTVATMPKKTEKVVDDEVIDNTTMVFNNKEVVVERIFKNGINYIKLRDLEKFGMKISYDSDRKMPIISK